MQEKFLGVFMGGVFFLKGRMEGEIAGQRKEKKNCRRHDFSHQKKKKKIMEWKTSEQEGGPFRYRAKKSKKKKKIPHRKNDTPQKSITKFN